jgi:hypothetical protein
MTEIGPFAGRPAFDAPLEKADIASAGVVADSASFPAGLVMDGAFARRHVVERILPGASVDAQLE